MYFVSEYHGYDLFLMLYSDTASIKTNMVSPLHNN